ncbi:MAG: hypothetical protein EZS28_039183 [Streblomastix strix]|uniref:Uncharacterized protein n=1 Tax=Streblomastix strix TaxID=222440 RepID=A0A5J4U539_9EUKA|nr:MAG: hypothetical protein EZS28_039183 [Streblomastix strix]
MDRYTVPMCRVETPKLPKNRQLLVQIAIQDRDGRVEGLPSNNYFKDHPLYELSLIDLQLYDPISQSSSKVREDRPNISLIQQTSHRPITL